VLRPPRSAARPIRPHPRARLGRPGVTADIWPGVFS
jgi:hypothetical protein